MQLALWHIQKYELNIAEITCYTISITTTYFAKTGQHYVLNSSHLCKYVDNLQSCLVYVTTELPGVQ